MHGESARRGRAGVVAAHANAAQAAPSMTSAQTCLANETLQSAMFGPASNVVKACSVATLLQVAQHLEGQLSADWRIAWSAVAAHAGRRSILCRGSPGGSAHRQGVECPDCQADRCYPRPRRAR